MNSNKTFPLTEARRNIFRLAQEVQKPGTYFTFTEKGVPKAVLLSAEEFDSWLETLAVYQEMPDLEHDIKKAEREYAREELTPLEEILEEHGYILADKGKQTYVPRRARKKSQKRTGKA